MEFKPLAGKVKRNNTGISFEYTKKPLYLCRPYRGVEQYPSAGSGQGTYSTGRIK